MCFSRSKINQIRPAVVARDANAPTANAVVPEEGGVERQVAVVIIEKFRADHPTEDPCARHRECEEAPARLCFFH